MRKIMVSIFEAIYELKGILLVTFFIIFVYAVVGMILWNGDTHYRCRQTQVPVNGDWAVIETDERSCKGRQCPQGYCGSLYEQYETDPDSLNLDIIGTLKRDSQVPYLNHGRADFDDLRSSLIVTFQVLTIEGWVRLYYMMTSQSKRTKMNMTHPCISK
jgi:hypothetical protein